MNLKLSPFRNPAAVASYVHDTPQKVPGLADLHRMAAILLGEGAPGSAHIFVVGAGGGLELKALAELRSDWRFTGVDPSPAMLDIARQTSAPYADRITLLEGTVDQAPMLAFDGATCLLTLHFLDTALRLHTLSQIRRRLRPGSRFVVAHHTAPDANPQSWLARSAAFAKRAGSSRANEISSAKSMADQLPLLPPIAEEELLLSAGFTEPSLFYAAFSFRGWVATAG
ncbi:class I SAM-dependent methyltransferase [Aureimonas fodinaquatilis]|uniref:Class I SAM-dependent methyltransferase n=1 Tax=Aureimonas fodinaquatilis TaxID=2565783 RepID=A0A5B0E1E8_9HYPH|nr:class I SAM-dependent methyltransferase [Aureimonas fodinaquatilis]KAA0971945.1 class I SAM-dependent methyltransferase [Aureimonas fodinaquatilis]